LAATPAFAVQRLHCYIILRKTIVIDDVNPFQYVLNRHTIRGKYNKSIVILQEFDLEFISAKSKKSLVFAELISEFLSEDFEEDGEFPDAFVMLISSSDP